MGFMVAFTNMEIFKVVGPPKNYLGGYFNKIKVPKSILTVVAHTYVKIMMVDYEQAFG